MVSTRIKAHPCGFSSAIAVPAAVRRPSLPTGNRASERTDKRKAKQRHVLIMGEEGLSQSTRKNPEQTTCTRASWDGPRNVLCLRDLFVATVVEEPLAK